MLGSEFKTLRDSALLTEENAAYLFSVDLRTIRDWEDGLTPIPTKVAKRLDEVARRMAQAIEVRRRAQALGVPECHWEPDRGLSSRAFLRQIEEHEKTCAICQARNEIVVKLWEERQGPTPQELDPFGDPPSGRSLWPESWPYPKWWQVALGWVVAIPLAAIAWRIGTRWTGHWQAALAIPLFLLPLAAAVITSIVGFEGMIDRSTE